jgi:hypothetical protein
MALGGDVMVSRVLRSCRLLIAALAVLAVVGAPGAAQARVTFDASGTVYSKNESKETIVLITDALGKKNQPITIDMSDMSDNFVAIRVGQSVTLEIAARESDSYKAYSIRDQDSYVQGNDLGTQERYETQSSSIKAHVGNVPEDDEALNQQHRQNNLQRNQDDSHDNSGNNND